MRHCFVCFVAACAMFGGIGSAQECSVEEMFAPVSYPAMPAGVTDVACVNVNDDEHIDLMTLAASTPMGLRALINNGDGTFTPQPEVAGFGPRLFTHDLNGDGRSDFVLFAPTWNQICFVRNLGGGTYSDPQYLTTPGVTQSMAAMDYDDDGDVDVLCNVGGYGIIAFLNHNGTGVFLGGSVDVFTDFAPLGFCLHDLDSDGLADLTILRGSPDPIAMLLEEHGSGGFDVQQVIELSIDAADLIALLAGWGGAETDITGDGTTDAQDLLALIAAWGDCWA